MWVLAVWIMVHRQFPHFPISDAILDFYPIFPSFFSNYIFILWVTTFVSSVAPFRL